jgi:phytanoyl-CoA hydroxylase
VIGLWVALEDATTANGCMFAAPRSHEGGLLRRFVRDGDTLSFEGEPLGEAELAKYEFEPIEVSAGDLVLLHGENIHLSRENTSAESRHAYIVHVVEGAAGNAWSPRNWLQRRADMPFEPL